MQYVERELQMPVSAIATLADLLHYLQAQDDPVLAGHIPAVAAYRTRYGV